MIMQENMVVIREHKNFYFYLDWPKYFDKNLKHKSIKKLC